MREQKLSLVNRTRRGFLQGQALGTGHHIASLLVQAWPDRIPEIESRLTGVPGVEIHGSGAGGKMILTVESENDAGLVDAIGRIESTDGVITVSLVYHHSEETGDE